MATSENQQANRETLGERTSLIRAVVGSSLGIGICAFLSYKYFEPWGSKLLIGSFGASTVILYTAIQSQFAQPRSLLGGHVISALAGVVVFKLLSGPGWLTAALAVSLALIAMLLTKTVHPPGGATALIAATASPDAGGIGFDFVLVPVGLGVLILLAVACAVYNFTGERYPQRWL